MISLNLHKKYNTPKNSSASRHQYAAWIIKIILQTWYCLVVTEVN